MAGTGGLARPGDYSNCQLTQPDWIAAPNSATGAPSTVEAIEMAIPFTKPGVSSSRPFGLALRVSDTGTLNRSWPEAADPGNPSTWATARPAGQ